MRRWLSWALALALLPMAGATLLRPDPRDALRAADQLFLAGRYYEALAAYQAPAATLPSAELRLGMLHTLRGEPGPAERRLRSALGGLGDSEYHLALLYLGAALAADGRDGLALRTWALTEDCRSPAACAYRGPARALAAELALRAGDHQAAEGGYRAALAAPLPPGWAELAALRLALLVAPRDPGAALAALAAPPAAAPQPLLEPLRPGPGATPEQLGAVLAAPPAELPQLLGQLYLGLGLDSLAIAQFARVDPAGPLARSAAAYAAYAAWRSGGAGREQLEALVAAHPGDARARTLLALTYLGQADLATAESQLTAVAAISPGDPDAALAWASWHAARREYDLAADAYAQAVALAPEGRRGRYALAAAQFHLATTFELCARGLPMAEAAAAAAPQAPAALAALAAHQQRCGQPAAAADSARQAIGAGAGAEAHYYRGLALASLGDYAGARAELIRAADLAPASPWRSRAEQELAILP